ncbi:MAG: DUF4350 domain-containing protein [Candidatus Aminicenantes bacterium]|nr:DUF4350 domain-containing protein [Candidatus Aminicenantes bacterium]
MMKKILIILTVLIILLLTFYLVVTRTDWLVYQRADLSVSGNITNPAYAQAGPVILIDEGHNNFHTREGRYKPFAQLLTSDGYRVRSLTQEISAASLSPADVLVIANALEPLEEPEIAALLEWIREGKSLLLTADHPPFASPMKAFCNRIGVRLSGTWTRDHAQEEPGAPNPSWIRFEREKGTLADHPIFAGRNAGERIDVVVSFTGQSIAVKTGTVLLKLSPEAKDYETREQSKEGIAGQTAAGNAQAVAIEYGNGRIVVTGEAGMLTAQVVRIFLKKERFGFSRPGNDNRRFVLNVLHWLTRLI